MENNPDTQQQQHKQQQHQAKRQPERLCHSGTHNDNVNVDPRIASSGRESNHGAARILGQEGQRDVDWCSSSHTKRSRRRQKAGSLVMVVAASVALPLFFLFVMSSVMVHDRAAGIFSFFSLPLSSAFSSYSNPGLRKRGKCPIFRTDFIGHIHPTKAGNRRHGRRSNAFLTEATTAAVAAAAVTSGSGSGRGGLWMAMQQEQDQHEEQPQQQDPDIGERNISNNIDDKNPAIADCASLLDECNSDKTGEIPSWSLLSRFRRSMRPCFRSFPRSTAQSVSSNQNSKNDSSSSKIRWDPRYWSPVRIYAEYAGRLWNETNGEARQRIARDKVAAAVKQVQQILLIQQQAQQQQQSLAHSFKSCHNHHDQQQYKDHQRDNNDGGVDLYDDPEKVQALLQACQGFLEQHEQNKINSNGNRISLASSSSALHPQRPAAWPDNDDCGITADTKKTTTSTVSPGLTVTGAILSTRTTSAPTTIAVTYHNNSGHPNENDEVATGVIVFMKENRENVVVSSSSRSGQSLVLAPARGVPTHGFVPRTISPAQSPSDKSSEEINHSHKNNAHSPSVPSDDLVPARLRNPDLSFPNKEDDVDEDDYYTARDGGIGVTVALEPNAIGKNSVSSSVSTSVVLATSLSSSLPAVSPLPQGPQKKKKKRRSILFGAVMGMVVACWVFSGNYIFTGLFSLMTILGQLEYYRMVINTGVYPARRISVVGACSMFWTALFCPQHHQIILPLFGLWAMIWFLTMKRTVTTIPEIATTFTGMFYLGYVPSFWVRIRLIGAATAATAANRGGRETTRLAPLLGPWLQLLHQRAEGTLPAAVLGVFHLPITTGAIFIFWTWLCLAFSDVAAYFVGKNLGKTPLGKIAPAAGATSPNKTVEGVVGGCAVSALLGMCGAWVQKWPYWALTGFVHGTLLGLIGLIGDLTASMIKRDAGIKDFGDLIPEHGGILDRVDSFVWSAPYSWLVCHTIIPALKNAVQ